MNDPNFDDWHFVGPTRALFERFTVDYQNDLKPASWLTLTSGFFYSQVDAGQERPFVSQPLGRSRRSSAITPKRRRFSSRRA